jgi:hypothetical protein
MRKDTDIHMSLGDAIDRISILARKIHFGEHDAIKEFEYLTERITKLSIPMSGAILACIIRITQANVDIWNHENELRRGDKEFLEKMGYEEIGKRAIMIRDLNKKRVEYKNEINRLTEMGFREFKIKHRSQ